MTYTGHVIDGGGTRPGRWLRSRRLKVALWIAAVEALLVVLHVMHWWVAVLLAVIAVGFWWFAGRRNRLDLVRQASWIFAVSQLLVVIVPAALAIATTIAIAVFALLAIGALVFLFTQRH